MRARRRILEDNMTVVKDRIMFSEIKNIKVCPFVCLFVCLSVSPAVYWVFITSYTFHASCHCIWQSKVDVRRSIKLANKNLSSVMQKSVDFVG